ncbi:hypothetical protein PHIN3_380 [Sinorhizobium phage phiN3]|uniref:Uncharacterized protein n=1 Tax=Sinorhizobium phage phiN3 TaxID=1647405 RepID=A0A0F6SJ61_9CAUD|nr:hypothetical protein AVT40_gp153 [Sinorhizobium phage phiN3]AKF13643.1 hypothetical protein PHIN3_380 [Sinorhizobium phage phiN3]
MSKPNRVVANMPKNPFERVFLFPAPKNEAEAEAAVEELKAQGFDAKYTRYKFGSFKKPQFAWNVWKREKVQKGY